MALPSSIPGASVGSGQNPGASAPQVTQDGNPVSEKESAPGGKFPLAPPGKDFQGTLPGDGQRKPFNVR